MTAAEGEKAKNDARPHAACPRARTSTPSGPVWRPDEVGGTVPVACRDREKALPDAWRCAGFRWTERAAQRQLQARPLYRRGDRLSQMAKASNTRGKGVDQEAASALRASGEPWRVR